MKTFLKSIFGGSRMYILTWLLPALVVGLLFPSCGKDEEQVSTRKERRLIAAGNDLYNEQKIAEAKSNYREALVENPASRVAKFNIGLSDIRLADLNKDNDSIAGKLKAEGVEALTQIARMGKENPALASKANYNLGNLQFEQENYGEAINLYKQALRLNPQFEDARRNLRIAQLKKQDDDQDQDQNKDQDQQQDQQDQQQDQQDQEQDEQQDQQDQQNQDQNDSQQQPKDNELSQQAAEQILNAVENNEQRARQHQNKGEKAKGSAGRLKKW